MAFITINVPDSKLDYYKQILSEFDDISLENEELDLEEVFSANTLKMLEERQSKSLDESIGIEELKHRIKAKYAEYGL
jgi:hypothetical protein